MRKQNLRKQAFTLIELLLVMVILVVLAAVVVPRFGSRQEQAKKTRATVDISTLKTQLKMFDSDVGRLPTNEEGLGALIAQPTNADNWHGPYIEGGPSALIDPWKNPYIYKIPPSHQGVDFDLYSTGPDGRDGGNDDITNWDAQ
jgi:general secretion pathway protein G